MKKISLFILLFVLLLSFSVPLLASAQIGAPNIGAITPYSNAIIDLINNILVPVLMAIAFIVFLYGVYRYFILGATSDADRATGRQVVLWGIIGFAVILSLWGLVNIVNNFFNLTNQTNLKPPTFNASSGDGSSPYAP